MHDSQMHMHAATCAVITPEPQTATVDTHSKTAFHLASHLGVDRSAFIHAQDLCNMHMLR